MHKAGPCPFTQRPIVNGVNQSEVARKPHLRVLVVETIHCKCTVTSVEISRILPVVEFRERTVRKAKARFCRVTSPNGATILVSCLASA